MKCKLTQAKVKSLFTYNNGSLSKLDGSSSGNVCPKDGYKRIYIGEFDRYFYEHRLIFLYHHGYMPKLVDHKDRNRTNSAIENLRDLSYSANCRNSKVNVRNTSGTKGVSFEASRKRWKAQGMIDGKQKFIGRYNSKEEAINARTKWEEENNYVQI